MDFAVFKQRFTVTQAEVRALFKIKVHPENRAKIFFALLGVLLLPLTLAGTLLRYVHGYNRIMEPKDEPPVLVGLRPIMRVAMVIGAVLIWVVMWVGVILFYLFIRWLNVPTIVLWAWFGVNLVVSLTIYVLFILSSLTITWIN